jgi:hypothetical protein
MASAAVLVNLICRFVIACVIRSFDGLEEACSLFSIDNNARTPIQSRNAVKNT